MSQKQSTETTAKKAIKVAAALAAKKMKLATLKIQLIVGATLLLIVLLIVSISGIVAIIGGDVDEANPEGVKLPPGQMNVSSDVLQYRDKVNTELTKYSMSEYTDVLLALMMQESGGRGSDPMQSSESYCGSIGCITDPDTSIEKGILHFKNVFEKANKDIKLTLQSYNFGGGFIDYVKERGGKYSFDLAVAFSQMWYKKVPNPENYTCARAESVQYNACYGDIMYVDSVLKYLPQASGDTEIVKGDYKSPLKIKLLINSVFSWRDIGAGNEHHNGLDLDCNTPDSIHAVQDGVVAHAGWADGYGNLVTIKHGASHYTSYGHMSKIVVSEGESIEGGNQIGVCGTTGRSTGEHLHFEVKTEKWGGYKNPASYLGLGG